MQSHLAGYSGFAVALLQHRHSYPPDAAHDRCPAERRPRLGRPCVSALGAMEPAKSAVSSYSHQSVPGTSSDPHLDGCLHLIFLALARRSLTVLQLTEQMQSA